MDIRNQPQAVFIWILETSHRRFSFGYSKPATNGFLVFVQLRRVQMSENDSLLRLENIIVVLVLLSWASRHENQRHSYHMGINVTFAQTLRSVDQSWSIIS